MEDEPFAKKHAEIIDIFTARHAAGRLARIILTGPSQTEPPEGYHYKGTTPQGVSIWEFGGPQVQPSQQMQAE